MKTDFTCMLYTRHKSMLILFRSTCDNFHALNGQEIHANCVAFLSLSLSLLMFFIPFSFSLPFFWSFLLSFSLSSLLCGFSSPLVTQHAMLCSLLAWPFFFFTFHQETLIRTRVFATLVSAEGFTPQPVPSLLLY